MVILKKVRAATLVETMVASVIIVIVFLIASLSLNNVFKGTIQANDSALENRIRELSYLTENGKVTVPFYEDTEQWEIAIEESNGRIILNVLNKKTAKKSIINIKDAAP